MAHRQGIDREDPVDLAELTIRACDISLLFMFLLKQGLMDAPMKSQTYMKGYSLENVET